jgi:hypothetical protein
MLVYQRVKQATVFPMVDVQGLKTIQGTEIAGCRGVVNDQLRVVQGAPKEDD